MGERAKLRWLNPSSLRHHSLNPQEGQDHRMRMNQRTLNAAVFAAMLLLATAGCKKKAPAPPPPPAPAPTAPAPAANAHVRSDDPVFRAVRPRCDARGLPRRAAPRRAGDFRNAIRCYSGWTWLERPNLPGLRMGFFCKLVGVICVFDGAFGMPASGFRITFFVVFGSRPMGACGELVLLGRFAV